VQKRELGKYFNEFIIKSSARRRVYCQYEIGFRQTKNFFIDFYLPKRVHFKDEKVFDFEGNYLNSDLKNFYNPNGELSGEDFIDFNSDYLKKIVALPFVNAKTKEMVYFPVNILQNLYVSNGLASGNSMTEAKVQALSEIIERTLCQKFQTL